MHGTLPSRPASASRLALFAEPDFRRLWHVGLVVFVVRWLETLAVAVFVYQQTGSAFLVAMMTLLRLLPMGLFGAFIGAVAERVERRSLLLLILGVSLVTSLALLLLALGGLLAVWHLAIASFINGLSWAADNPVRRMMIGEVAGPDRMGLAMSIDAGSNNASRMLGPTVGGLLLAYGGIEAGFALGVLLYCTALPAAWRLRCRNGGGASAGRPVLARIREGMEAVRRDPRLVGTLIVTAIFNLFGWPCTSMVPVIGADRLGLGPEGIGLLASMDGVGAFTGAVLMALFSRPAIHRHCYLGGILLYLVMMPLFALVPWVVPAALALFLAGLGQAGFAIMQATLVYLYSPPELRSRVLGLLSVCIGIGPLGFLMLGGLAEWLGAPAATLAMGCIGLASMALTQRYWRRI